jgi:hypothetical protein
MELSATAHLRGPPNNQGIQPDLGEIAMLSVGKGGMLSMSVNAVGLDPSANFYLRMFREGEQERLKPTARRTHRCVRDHAF